MTQVLLTATGLRKTYEMGRVRALDGVDLTLRRGECVSVIGPSGSGKSTLLHVLGALDRPDEGRVVLDGTDYSTASKLDRVRARTLGFVFQLHNLMPALTAVENVELPLYALRTPSRERRARASALLDAVGLADRADHRPSQLSGGQRQRVAIARALVNDPSLVLADEPTGDLDQAASDQILDVLRGLQRERGLTLLLVTHDANVAEAADRTIRIVDGRIVEASATPPTPG